jgi:heptaprenyl diphosphate synthase
LWEAGATAVDADLLHAACTATELTHTASLCHDDVVDNALFRRSMPTLWQSAGPAGAILVGDLLLFEAADLMMGLGNEDLLRAFVDKGREVVAAEAEHELCWRGKQPDEATSLRLARGKTGALFAFPAQCCGGDDEALSAGLAEAGYCIGTAYQLADDLLDVVGDDSDAGKTLGTDQQREKFTLPQNGESGVQKAAQQIRQLCLSADKQLADFPAAAGGVRAFLLNDFQPVLNRQLASTVELTV